MAISETTLKDTMLMLIGNAQNEKGGVLGLSDRGGKWLTLPPTGPLFREKARELLTVNEVECDLWQLETSVSAQIRAARQNRKS